MSAPDLAAALASGDPATRSKALSSLAARLRVVEGPVAIDDAVASALLIPLGSTSRTEQRHTADLVAPLVTVAGALLAALRGALASPDARLRWGAAYALGRALPPTRELWPSALETMRLDDGDQRWAAAELACRIARNDATILAEIRAALADPSPTLRKMLLYCLRDLGVSLDKVNVNGGAIAMGHPLGATGCIILGTLLEELERRHLNLGCATLCVGGGMGIATIIERV